MKKSGGLQTAWPTMIGAMVGVELMLSSFLLWGPAAVTSEALSAYTESGAGLFRPEHDLVIYLVGCVTACGLIVGLAALGSRRQLRAEGSPNQLQPRDRTEDDAEVPMRRAERELGVRVIGQRWAQVLVCLVLFSVHLGLVLITQQFLPPAGGQWFWPVAVSLLVLPVLSICVAFLEGPGSWLRCPSWPGLRLHDLPDLPLGRLGPWPDLLVVLCLIVVIYVPRCAELAGRLFTAEYLHHWDFYAMGPTLAFHYGKALGTEAYTQYGVGWPLLFDRLSPLVPISYSNMIHVAVVYCCAYFIGVYAFLRYLLRSRLWAAAGVCSAVALQLFSGTDSVLWQYPSSTVLRSPLDIWCFICVLCHSRTGRRTWLHLASGLAGAGVLFGTDTGTYLVVAVIAYCVLFRTLPTAGRDVLRSFLSAARCAGVALAVILPMLWLAGRGTLGLKRFWTGWLEPVVTYSGGIGALPAATAPPLALLLFSVVVVTYLVAVGVTLVKLTSHDNTAENLVLACVGVYGLATLLLFVGRSHPFNLLHGSVPFTILTIGTLARWCMESGRLETDLPTRAGGPDRVSVRQRGSRSRALPWAVLAGGALLITTDWRFWDYPGVIQSAWPAPPLLTACLISDEHDVCGLSPQTLEFRATFESVTAAMRQAAASGRTVAMLDNADPMFYLAAKVRPWSRYSPSLPALFTRDSVAQLVKQIADSGPEVVVVRSGPAGILFLDARDVWRVVHDTIATHYRLDSTIGVFEVWIRKTA